MRCTAVLVAGFGLVGCVSWPQPPPLLGEPGKPALVAFTEGLPYSPAKAVVSGPKTAPVAVKADLNGYQPAALFDPRGSLSYRFVDRVRCGGHLGLSRAGLELSVLPRGDQVDTPIVVAVGGQVNAVAQLIGFSKEMIWDARAQLSVHPRVSRDVQLMLGVGLSTGRQEHDLLLPDSLGQRGAEESPLLETLRRENRLEGVIGVSFSVNTARIVLAAQPFYVVGHGAVVARPCEWCFDTLQVDSLDASWGAAFTLTVAASGP